MNFTSKMIIKVDRSSLFDPVLLIGVSDSHSTKRWSIRSEDKDALAIREFDLRKITFEKRTTSTEKFLSKRFTRLDAKAFLAVWKNRHILPKEWCVKTNGISPCIVFDGSTLRGESGNDYYLHMQCLRGEWVRGHGLASCVLASDVYPRLIKVP